jgi:hypothetical protein
LKNLFEEHLNEKISDRINCIVAYAQHCFGSRRRYGSIGKSKPSTRGHGRKRARDRPK